MKHYDTKAAIFSLHRRENWVALRVVSSVRPVLVMPFTSASPTRVAKHLRNVHSTSYVANCTTASFNQPSYGTPFPVSNTTATSSRLPSPLRSEGHWAISPTLPGTLGGQQGSDFQPCIRTVLGLLRPTPSSPSTTATERFAGDMSFVANPGGDTDPGFVPTHTGYQSPRRSEHPG
ncbi:uncharacterized protein LY79DRAFT_583653 [Colletotrichum navitas]|uniref:Uncharacterized protein n=1 Tax=Colletotrichum navitas TaxID=681940 RepID=A0AAD8PPL9_9PEZI|nr:uncharacterized protein LY79DRAFT_583653 [Colletotrichum navitas]KAK1573440.1 hypothetical protein LY79DRAFT_583653 [Colletotrichum navitas]